jgi:dolichol kinase
LLGYPIAILILVLIFRHQRHIVAATWAILAFGDGFASLLGRPFGVRKLPWNAEKSYVGFFSFALFGSVGAVLFTLWIAWGDPALARLDSLLLVVPMAAALLSAIVETLPIRVDDNFTVAFTGAGVMYWLYQLLG